MRLEERENEEKRKMRSDLLLGWAPNSTAFCDFGAGLEML